MSQCHVSFVVKLLVGPFGHPHDCVDLVDLVGSPVWDHSFQTLSQHCTSALRLSVQRADGRDRFVYIYLNTSLGHSRSFKIWSPPRSIFQRSSFNFRNVGLVGS